MVIRMNPVSGASLRAARLQKTRLLRPTAVITAALLLLAACGNGEVEDDADETEEADTTAEDTEDETDEADEADTAEDTEADGDYSYSLDLAHYTSMETALGQTLQAWADDVEELAAGDVDITIHANESLVDVADSLTATRDGRTDIAFTATLYHQADLPLTTITEVPFLTADANAQVRAIEELYSTDEDLEAEFRDQGVHLLHPIPASVALLGSPDEPLVTMEQLQGLDVRAVGSSASVVEAAGGNPIAITFPEIYESLERGVIDAFSEVVLDAAVATGLYEVAPYLSDPGVGPPAIYPLVITDELWQDMPEDLHEAFRTASEQSMDEVIDIQMEFDLEACDQLEDAGASVTLWEDEDIEELSDALGDTLLDEWRDDAEAAGHDADAFLEAYEDLIEEHADPDHTTGTAECADQT